MTGSDVSDSDDGDGFDNLASRNVKELSFGENANDQASRSKVESESDADESRNREGAKRRSSRAITQNRKVIESGTSEDDSDSDAVSSSRKRKIDHKLMDQRKKARTGTDSDDNDSNDGEDNAESGNGSEVDDYDDDMFLDDEDRRRLEEMTEKEREAEIFKRVEQREILRARHAIEKKIRAKKESSSGLLGKERKERRRKQEKDRKRAKELAKSRNSEADSGHTEPGKAKQQTSNSPSEFTEHDAFDEYQRPSELQQKRKQKTAMADLVNRRKDKLEAEQKKKALSRKSALDIDEVFGNGSDGDYEKSSSSSSRTSSRSSSRSSNKARIRSPSPQKSREVNSLADIQRIRLPRRLLCKIVHAPFFAKTVVGCFVRVGIGTNKERCVYRAAQILDVVETAKVYKLEETRTNKGFRLKHGKEERVYRLEYVSNSDINQHEFVKWIDAMKSNNLSIPTMDQIEKKARDIKTASAYRYTDKDIELMVKEKGRFINSPGNYAMEKGNLIRLKQEAEQYGNVDEVRRLQQQIDELDTRATELDRRRSQSIRGISWINQRNRQAMKEAILSGQVHVEISNQDDPFTRKNARMRPVSGRDKANPQNSAVGDISGDYVPKSQPMIAQAFDTKSIVKQQVEIDTISGHVSDLFSAHNFDVDIDISLPNSLSPSTGSLATADSFVRQSSLVARSVTSKSSRPLSLEDYKRRRGLL